MISRRPTRAGLAVATGVLVVSVAAAPWLASWAYEPRLFRRIGLILSAPLLPPLGVAIWQQSAHRARTTFGSRPLIAAAICDAAAVSAIAAAGDGGVLMSFVLVPVAATFAAFSWVQPPEGHRLIAGATIILGGSLPPLLSWLVVRAGHRPGAGLLAAAVCVTGVLASLMLLHRASRHLMTDPPMAASPTNCNN